MKTEHRDVRVGVHWDERSDSQPIHATGWVSFLDPTCWTLLYNRGRGMNPDLSSLSVKFWR